MSKNVLVVGGGPAGIEAAKAAAMAGASVSLISDSPVGGRAGWHSLLPSKVWLSVADTLGLLPSASTAGLALAPPVVEPAAILKHIQSVAQQWHANQAEMLDSLGVTVVQGLAVFEDALTVQVQNQAGPATRHHAEAVIVASGSVPFFPPALKPDGDRILAPRFASHLKTLPKTAVVIGAGPTGSEFVYLFNRLGVAVTWIIDQYGVLPGFAPAAGQALADALQARGVRLAVNQLADHITKLDDGGVAVVTSSGEQHLAEIAFVAIGRHPDLSRLNLRATGLELPSRRVPAVDSYGQTSVAGLYLVGDAAGPPMVANRALAQAWVAGQHAAGAKVRPFNPQTVVYATYTEPQVAQVGTVSGAEVQTARVSFDSTLKALLLPPAEEAAFVELAYLPDGRLVGATAVGPHAGEVLAVAAVAIQQGLSVADLAVLYPAHPTLSELVFMAARAARAAL